MNEQEAYVAFNLTEQIGSVTVAKLAAAAGSVVAAWEAYPKKVSRVGGEVDFRAEFAKAKRYGVEILTPADAAYPARLKEVPGHPLALYVKGDVAALSKPAVSIVGTRRATPYGKDQAYRFGKELAERGWMILSGLATGIDGEAHKGALAAGGLTVGVLGSALDEFYPEENRELAREIVKAGGAVVSEFPFGRPPDKETFPQRNRIVAALAAGVLAVECPVKSGTLITTSLAADMGRVVMAIPGRVDSRSSAGCLSLLRDGARLVRSPADVEEELSELFPQSTRAVKNAGTVPDESAEKIPVPTPKFSLEESMVMRYVDNEGISIDRLVALTGLPVGKVNAITMALRLKGRARFLPGNRVALPRDA